MQLLKIVLIVFVLLGPWIVKSQATADAWLINRIQGPSQKGIVDSIPVDINKDGLMDVVSASYEDGHVRAYINQGGYEFSELMISNDIYGAFKVTAADINNDEAIDFIVPSIETHEIVLLMNEGNNIFSKQIIADNILLPTDAQSGDFNNDGLMDIISISFENDAVYLHLQKIGNEFQTIQINSIVDGPRKLVVADFDLNQSLDFLLVSSEDSTVRLFSNNGQLSFQESVIHSDLLGARFINSCDLNGDALVDFVAAATDANQIWLFTNRGQQTFDGVVLDDTLPAAIALHCVDFDGDSQQELVAVSSQLSNIYTFELTGKAEKTLLANSRDGYVSLNSAVFEPNDSIQILSQTFFQNRNLLYEPTALNQERVVWEDFPDGAYAVKSGDLNGDNKIDFVYAAFRDNRILWAQQQSKGKYDVRTVFDQIDGPQSVYLADMDNDTDLDIISAGAWDDTFWLHTNNGQGIFSTTAIFNMAINAARVTVFDVNEDGLMDVIGTSSLDDSVRWFEQTTNGFIPHLISNQLDGALAITHADLNQDMKQDIIVGNYFGNSISLFINSGQGIFTEFEVSDSPVKPTSLAASDYDNDGDIDLAFNSNTQGSIWRVENISGELVSEILVSNQYSKVEDVVFVDVMGNSNKDIVAVGGSDLGVKAFVEFQQKQFEPQALFDDAFGFRSLQNVPPLSSELIKLVAASNTSNSIITITLNDLIFKDSF